MTECTQKLSIKGILNLFEQSKVTQNNILFFTTNLSKLDYPFQNHTSTLLMDVSKISLKNKYFNFIRHKMGPGQSTKFFVTSFAQKMPESSDSMYSSILKLEKI